ncbi:MAG TPA: hypothetical protein VFU31_11505 [Candidatus Binatia bacterium]|nr:hypothetical protein [Candidatus Binatia bacterium]
MRNLLKSQFGLCLLWAALLGVFIFVRPASGSWLFWTLLIVVSLVAAAYLLWSYLESKSLKESVLVWRHRLDSLVDIMDVEDDGHLYEWFDPPDWDRILLELERMPKGSRNLRKAIKIIDPDFEL